jgi:hypothetical protein
MGLGTALYRRSLLPIDRVDLPSSQCIFFRFLVELFSFGFDVLCPCQSSIEMHAQIYFKLNMKIIMFRSIVLSLALGLFSRNTCVI